MQVSTETRRGHQLPWSGSHGSLDRCEELDRLRHSERTASTLSHWPVSPAPNMSLCWEKKNTSLVLKQNDFKIISNIHFFAVVHFFLSGRTLNHFEFSSGIIIRVTFKRFLRKCHINIAIIHSHSMNPLLHSFGAPLGFC